MIPTKTLTETDADLAARFAELTARWHEETRFTSKVKTMRENPAYREIVAMGERAIPLILADLEKNGSFGFLALSDITGAKPVPKGSAGKVDEMAAAWIAWGRAQDYAICGAIKEGASWWTRLSH